MKNHSNLPIQMYIESGLSGEKADTVGNEIQFGVCRMSLTCFPCGVILPVAADIPH